MTTQFYNFTLHILLAYVIHCLIKTQHSSNNTFRKVALSPPQMKPEIPSRTSKT